MNSYHLFQGKKVTLMCCSDCNVNCRHCYLSFNGNFSEEELYDCAKHLSEEGKKVYLNGSEVLLHQEYLQTFKMLGQFKAMTNGLVFKDNLSYLDRLQDYGIDTYNISYHFDLQNIISPVSNVFLKQLFKEIIARNLKFTINCTISTINKDSIADYCQEAYSLGACRIRFTNLLNTGNAKQLERSLFLNVTQAQEVLESVRKCRLKYDKDEFYIERCGSFCASSTDHKFRCPAGVDSVVITPDKKIYSCVFLAMPGNEIGYYKDGQIYISDEFKNNQTVCLARSFLNGPYL